MKNRKTIMVCGHYACGRSSLIQAVCQEGTVPDKAINPTRIDYVACPVQYETDVVDFIDAQGMQFGELAVDYCQILEEIEQAHSPVDCTWYCIDGAKTVIQDGDEEILDVVDENTIVVITRSELMTEEMVSEMILQIQKYFPPENIVITSSKNKLGLNRLLEVSKKMIYHEFQNDTPAKWDKYFVLQKNWIKNARESAEKCIQRKTAKTFAILTSIPIPDKNDLTAPMIENNLHMFQQIGACYGYATDHRFCLFFIALLNDTAEASSLKEKLSISIMTYSYGYAVKAYFESDMTLSVEELNKIFDASKEECKKINWKNQPTGE